MGEPLILLPGMMCDERLFAPQIAAFSHRYAISVPALTHDTIEGMARAVLAEAPEGPLNVAGLSMGGIVAMMMAALEPERIGRLALLDTNHLADAAGRYDIRNRQIEEVKAGKLRHVMCEEMLPHYLAEANAARTDLTDLMIAMAMDLGEDVFVAQSLALRDRPDQSPFLGRFKGPALVLHGTEDRLCPPERHRDLAALLSDAMLVAVPGAGHISTLENPEAVNAALVAWLAAPLEARPA